VEEQRGAKKIETGPKMLPRIFVAQPETSDNETKLSQIFLFLLDSFFFLLPCGIQICNSKAAEKRKKWGKWVGEKPGHAKGSCQFILHFLG